MVRDEDDGKGPGWPPGSRRCALRKSERREEPSLVAALLAAGVRAAASRVTVRGDRTAAKDWRPSLYGARGACKAPGSRRLARAASTRRAMGLRGCRRHAVSAGARPTERRQQQSKGRPDPFVYIYSPGDFATIKGAGLWPARPPPAPVRHWRSLPGVRGRDQPCRWLGIQGRLSALGANARGVARRRRRAAGRT